MTTFSSSDHSDHPKKWNLKTDQLLVEGAMLHFTGFEKLIKAEDKISVSYEHMKGIQELYLYLLICQLMWKKMLSSIN